MLAVLGVNGFSDSAIDGLDDPAAVKNLTKLMMTASAEVKRASVLSLPIELAVVEWCQSLGKVKSGVDSGESEILIKKEDSVKTTETVEKKTSETLVTKEEEQVVASKITSPSSGDLKIEEVRLKWGEVLKALRPHNHSLEALLKATKPPRGLS